MTRCTFDHTIANCDLSQQWPDLQSKCREWKRVPDHLLPVCSCQSGTSPPPSGFGAETLGSGIFPFKSWPVPDIRIMVNFFFFSLLRCCRSVRSTVRRKEGCHRTSSPSWLFSTYRSAESLSCLLTWTRRCVSFSRHDWDSKVNIIYMFVFTGNWRKALIVFRLRCFHSADYQTSVSHM